MHAGKFPASIYQDHALNPWSDLLSKSEVILEMSERCSKIVDQSYEALQHGLMNVLNQIQGLERSYRSLNLYFKNAELERIRNVDFKNLVLST